MNTELIMAAEEQKQKITQIIQEIRDTATYLNTIDELGDKLQLVLQGAGRTIYLEKLMSPEILEANRQLILRDIAKAEEEKEKELRRLIHKPENINQDFENAVDEMIKENEARTVAVPEENKMAAVKGPANKKSKLPDEEEKALITKLYIDEGLPVKEIAVRMELTETNIYDRMKKYGIAAKKIQRPPVNISFDKKWQDEVIKMLKEGKTVIEISKHYGLDKSTVYKHMQEFGIVPKMCKPR